MPFQKGHFCYNKKDKIKKSCFICNTDFLVIPCRKHSAKFCSRQCSATARRGKKRRNFYPLTGENSPVFGRHHKKRSIRLIKLARKKQSEQGKEPMEGHKHTKEAREKMRQSQLKLGRRGEKSASWNGGDISLTCIVCGEIYYVERYRKFSKYCSRKCKAIMHSKRLCTLTGDKNYSWKGGVTSLADRIKRLPEYSEWRKKVLARDNEVCKTCGDTDSIEVHHKRSFKKLFYDFLQEYSQFSLIEDKETLVRLAITYKPFWDINNGEALCWTCHRLTYNYSNRESDNDKKN